MKILIADDHLLFRGGVNRILASVLESPVVVEAGDFDQISAAIESHPDLDMILLDLQMPGMNGLKGVKAVIEMAPDALTAVVSATEDRGIVMGAINAGAVGYIPKTSSPDVLISALQLIVSGGVYLPPLLILPNSEQSEGGPSGLSNGNAEVILTKRQKEVLTYLIQGKPNKLIAYELGISISAVKIHVSAILKALRVSNRTEAVSAARHLNF